MLKFFWFFWKLISKNPDYASVYAFVEHLITSVSCLAGQTCPETPIYVIKRGNSSISVSVPTGTIIQEEIADGEEEIFDFLKEALPKK